MQTLICEQSSFGFLTLSRLVALVRLVECQAALMMDCLGEEFNYAFDTLIAAGSTFSMASATLRVAPFVIWKLA